MIPRFLKSSFFIWPLLLMVAVFAYSLAGPATAAGHLTAGVTVPLLCFGIVNIRNLFTREAIIQYLEFLGPAFPTRVCDTVFKRRPQQPGPLIGSDIITQVVRAMPLGRRGARSITIAGAAGQVDFYEPFPIHPDISITGAELNNLRMFMQSPNSADLLRTWATTKTEVLRGTVRATCEAMCAVSLSGKLEFPVQLEGGGFETYSIDYGAIQTLADGEFKKWDDPQIKPKDLLEFFIKINVVLSRAGVGGEVLFWAGKDAFLALFDIVTKVLTSSKLQAEAGVSFRIGENYVMIGNIKVELAAEEYWNPQTKQYIPIIPVDALQAIAVNAGHVLPYASIDDLDGNLQPMPIFIKPVKTENPSGYSLIAESKPLPVVNPKGLFRVTVLAGGAE